MRLSDHPDINWQLQELGSSYGKGTAFGNSTVRDEAIVIEAAPASKSPLERQLINLTVKWDGRESKCRISVKSESSDMLLAILQSKIGQTIREIKRLDVPDKGNS